MGEKLVRNIVFIKACGAGVLAISSPEGMGPTPVEDRGHHQEGMGPTPVKDRGQHQEGMGPNPVEDRGQHQEGWLY